MTRWLLPEAISDVLPAEARRIEELRRRLLDLFRGYGYELVMPPLVEYLDSLLIGSGSDLDLRTFKLVDQLSGRTLGLRPDMTPQVARIDAHRLDRAGITRLCYAGSVLHARPAGLTATREPIQVGAEIYGCADLQADLEVIELMLAALGFAGAAEVELDLCHVGLVRALLRDTGLDEDDVFPLIASKDLPGLRDVLAGVRGDLRDALLALATLYGGANGADSVIDRARAALPDAPEVVAALGQIETIARAPMLSRFERVRVAVDFGDLRGYRYHGGITFAAYVEGAPNAVARGGRYDNVGAAFGRARPATGFSLELRALAGLTGGVAAVRAIRAPCAEDESLARAVQALRDQGEVVVRALPGQAYAAQEFECDRELVADASGGWTVRPIASGGASDGASGSASR
ncbi:MAG: ATP phosphoribosyltransferase regulatory subunit [Burkholderiales bacterium]|nr:MAG: ATP phosphoribosyltransferase regulatory subunit [Burkholderiales bacterium]